MKGLVNQGIGYGGTVRFKTVTKGIVNEFTSHNSGTKYLLDGLAEVMCGYDSSNRTHNVIPDHIDVVNSSNQSIMIHKPSKQGYVWGEPAMSVTEGSISSAALFRFTIYDSDLNPLTRSSESLRLLLLNSGGETLATIEDGVAAFIEDVSPTTDGLVEWTLSFSLQTNNQGAE